LIVLKLLSVNTIADSLLNMMHTKSPLSLLLIKLLVVSSTNLQSTRRVLKPPLPSPLDVKKNTPFDKGLAVSFDIEKPATKDWIGIYKDDGDKMGVNPYDNKRVLLFWLYTCGSQSPNTSYCKLPSGMVTFNGEDPTADNVDKWPIRPATYKACPFRKRGKLEDGEEMADLIGPCKKFLIKLRKPEKKRMARKASVVSKETTYKYGEKIKANFKTPIVTQNSWVGIYKKDPNEPIITMENQGVQGLVEPEMWLYTSCNNVTGDQKQSNSCSKKLKNGMVSFDESNTGGGKQEWPLPAGEYYMAISFYTNSPYKLFKSAKKTFEVKL